MEVSGGSQKGPWTQSAKGWAVPELPPGDGLPALSCQGPFPPPLSHHTQGYWQRPAVSPGPTSSYQAPCPGSGKQPGQILPNLNLSPLKGNSPRGSGLEPSWVPRRRKGRAPCCPMGFVRPLSYEQSTNKY